MPVWDISAASYDADLTGTLAEGTWGVAFKPDGTKMYNTDRTNRIVYQYTLSTPWLLSSATRDATSFTATAQVATALDDVEFNDDGTKMYLLDQGNKVFQYSLSTAWDVSTASYASKSLTVSGQDASAVNIKFKPDGSKLWMTGRANNKVYQYDLSTAWDVSTGSYASKSFTYTTQDSQPNSTMFKPDGTKMWMIGSSASGNPGLFQYSLSTPWDVSTASYDGFNYNIGPRDTSPRDIFIKADGTKLYFNGTATDKVYRYSLGTAAPAGGWRVGTIGFN